MVPQLESVALTLSKDTATPPLRRGMLVVFYSDGLIRAGYVEAVYDGCVLVKYGGRYHAAVPRHAVTPYTEWSLLGKPVRPKGRNSEYTVHDERLSGAISVFLADDFSREWLCREDLAYPVCYGKLMLPVW